MGARLILWLVLAAIGGWWARTSRHHDVGDGSSPELVLRLTGGHYSHSSAIVSHTAGSKPPALRSGSARVTSSPQYPVRSVRTASGTEVDALWWAP
jgi:hypothetical protein